MQAFADKIAPFDWLEIDGKHGTLRVWEDKDEHARLVWFAEDQTGKMYVLVDQTTDDDQDTPQSSVS
ncbi:MAG TPA: hypothetical protein VGJ60_27815 [Chloroflexota bacterium]|jgi:hypothetical protein